MAEGKRARRSAGAGRGAYVGVTSSRSSIQWMRWGRILSGQHPFNPTSRPHQRMDRAGAKVHSREKLCSKAIAHVMGMPVDTQEERNKTRQTIHPLQDEKKELVRLPACGRHPRTSSTVTEPVRKDRHLISSLVQLGRKRPASPVGFSPPSSHMENKTDEEKETMSHWMDFQPPPRLFPATPPAGDTVTTPPLPPTWVLRSLGAAAVVSPPRRPRQPTVVASLLPPTPHSRALAEDDAVVNGGGDKVPTLPPPPPPPPPPTADGAPGGGWDSNARVRRKLARSWAAETAAATPPASVSNVNVGTKGRGVAGGLGRRSRDGRSPHGMMTMRRMSRGAARGDKWQKERVGGRRRRQRERSRGGGKRRREREWSGGGGKYRWGSNAGWGEKQSGGGRGTKGGS